jgi:hypothetical protein
MKVIGIMFAIALFLAAIGGGLYVCIYQGWVLGIVGIIEAAKCEPVESWGVAWGVVRIVFANVAGAVVFWIGAAISGAIAAASSAR